MIAQPAASISANAVFASVESGLWRGFWWQGISLAVMNHV